MEPSPHLAAIRFGLGRRPGEPLPAAPLAWLDAQLAAPDAPPLPAGHDSPPGAAEGLAASRADREADRAGITPPPRNAGRLFRAEALAQATQLVTTATPWRERLVQFWANHFTCSRRAGSIGPLMGAYLRDAIRPHVTGTFADMLLAVARHPAMLLYLDNAGSIGPDSPIGQRSGRGLNENLAREILELHTVTPAAGYGQADVTEFARILTGWSVGRPVAGEAEGGFVFRARTHQPGGKTLMGRQYEEGVEAGEQALRWLAAHPATHRHLATKLARHFLADTPPPEAVARLEGVLRDSGGDLGAAARALPRLPQAWLPLTKLRQPWEYAVALARAVAAPNGEPTLGAMTALGQPLWAAPGPNGWPDEASAWAAPEALLRRTDLAWGVAGRAAASGLRDVPALAEVALGPLAQPATLAAAARAGSAREALTLILASPEMMRR